jgi:hypothetical protein
MRRRSLQRAAPLLAGLAIIAAGSAMPGCSQNRAGNTEFHPEAILGVAAFCAAGIFVPGLYDDHPPSEFDRQWQEIQSAAEKAHSKHH